MKNIIFILVIFLLLINCSENDPIELDTPDKVMMVMKEEGFDTLEAERGVDAGPNPNSDINSIQLNWYEPEDNHILEYYKIYRSDRPEGQSYYNLLATTENQTEPLDTVFTDSTQDLSTYNRYWYYVTAVNKDGEESEPSDTVFYRVIDKAYYLSIDYENPAEITEKENDFIWSINYDNFEVTSYYIRIEDNTNFHRLAYMKELSIDEFPGYESPLRYTISVDSFKISIVNGWEYRWRVDCKGMDLFSGSESDWAYFTVNISQ